MGDDAEKWLATTADGRNITIEVRQASTGSWWATVDGTPRPGRWQWPHVALCDATEHVMRDNAAVVELRRATEPSRAQLLAAVAAARQTLEHIAKHDTSDPDCGAHCFEEIALAARKTLAALPVRT